MPGAPAWTSTSRPCTAWTSQAGTWCASRAPCQAGIAVNEPGADEDTMPAAEAHALVIGVLAKPISLCALTALVDALGAPEGAPGPTPPTGR